MHTNERSVDELRWTSNRNTGSLVNAGKISGEKQVDSERFADVRMTLSSVYQEMRGHEITGERADGPYR